MCIGEDGEDEEDDADGAAVRGRAVGRWRLRGVRSNALAGCE